MSTKQSSFWRLIGYMRNYKGMVALNVISNILTAVFTALSIPLLVPFLEVLFDRRELILEQPPGGFSAEAIAAQFAI